VARLGGDEFVVLVSDLATEEDALTYGALLRRVLNAPLHLSRPIRISASIGIAFGDAGKYTTAEEMLEEADLAMYNAKSTTKGTVGLFTSAMRDAAIARVGLEEDMRRALEEGHFELRYQPQVDMASGAILGVEALLRWKHPDRGYISPAEFIPLAEETRLIVDIGEWVIEQALLQMKRWRNEAVLPPGFTMSINISAHQILGRNFTQLLVGRCRHFGVDPRSLCLEVPETVLMGDLPALTAELHKAVRAGFELDLDDFGTGFSSLRYLQHFPFGSVKIDRSFVADMCSNARSRSLVQTIVSLATSLDMRPLAEGVETPEQVTALLAMGCSKAQGFLYSPALTAAEIAATWLPPSPSLACTPVGAGTQPLY